MTNKNDIYDNKFFVDHKESARNAALKVLPIVSGLFQPSSVIDIGCGSGDWLSVTRDIFGAEIFGVDGKWNNLIKESGIPYTFIDFESQYSFQKRYDLGICLEVIEHLSPQAGLKLIKNLTECSDVILFSGAIPGQPGANHVNCQWQSYWRDEFEKLSYTAVDIVRPLIWTDDTVAWWYKQNIILYVKKGNKSIPLLQSADSTKGISIDLVHPQYYSEIIHWRDQNAQYSKSKVNELEASIKSPPTLRFVLGIIKRFTKSLLT